MIQNNYTVRVKSPVGTLESHAFERYAEADGTYKRLCRERTETPTSVQWLRDGQMYKRCRIDREWPRGEPREVVVNVEEVHTKHREETERLWLRVPKSLKEDLEQSAKAEGKPMAEYAVEKLKEHSNG